MNCVPNWNNATFESENFASECYFCKSGNNFEIVPETCSILIWVQFPLKVSPVHQVCDGIEEKKNMSYSAFYCIIHLSELVGLQYTVPSYFKPLAWFQSLCHKQTEKVQAQDWTAPKRIHIFLNILCYTHFEVNCMRISKWNKNFNTVGLIKMIYCISD